MATMTYKHLILRNMLEILLQQNNIPTNRFFSSEPMGAFDHAHEFIFDILGVQCVDDDAMGQWIQQIMSDLDATFCCEMCGMNTYQLELYKHITLLCPHCRIVASASKDSPAIGYKSGTGLEPVIVPNHN